MLELRTRLAIGVGVPVIIVIVLIGFIVFRNKTKTPPDTQEVVDVEELTNDPPAVKTDQGVTIKGTEDNIKEIPTPETPEEKEELYLRQLSRIFIERFYSYSSQNGNEHIEDVLPLATTQMQNYIKSQEFEQSQEYSGVTTQVIASKLEAKSEDAATISVKVQQTHMTLETSEKSQKSGKIEFIRDKDGQWKVDGVFWGE